MRSLRFMLALSYLVALGWGCGPDPGAPIGVLDCGVAPPLFSATGDIVQGEGGADAASGEGGCVRIERRAVPLEEDWMCKACPYTPVRMVVRVRSLDADLDLDFETTALTYEATHHNWADVVTTTDRANNAIVRILYDVADGGWDLEVTTEDAEAEDETVILPVVGSR